VIPPSFTYVYRPRACVKSREQNPAKDAKIDTPWL
jgi:hypothetical protein